MAKQQQPLPGKVVGCGRMRDFMRDKTPEQRAWYVEKIKEYPHLYPCPKCGGNWGYKAECAMCRDAVREQDGK